MLLKNILGKLYPFKVYHVPHFLDRFGIPTGGNRWDLWK